MRTSTQLSIALVLACLGLSGVQKLEAGELSRGAMLSASCEGCHGTDGNSPGTIPTISGRSADYLMKALSAYQSGERDSSIMQRHAKGYTSEELQLIAEHFAQVKKAEG